jgi:hypothetical protein
VTKNRDTNPGLRLPTASAEGPLAPESYTAFKLGDYYGEPIPNLVFRLRDGSRVAKAYHWLGEVTYHPSDGIGLVFPDAVFTLRGRNLLPVFTVVVAHAAAWVWEADRADVFLGGVDAVVIEEIVRRAGRV